MAERERERESKEHYMHGAMVMNIGITWSTAVAERESMAHCIEDGHGELLPCWVAISTL